LAHLGDQAALTVARQARPHPRFGLRRHGSFASLASLPAPSGQRDPRSAQSPNRSMLWRHSQWYIELAIKRLKSILNMDHLRAKKDSVLADLYLHGKLLYAWVIEKRLGRRCGLDWNRLDQPRRATPWRVVKLLQQELTSAISGVRQWDFRRWAEALKVMQERPRRRTLQTVPERIRQLIADCQARGVSNI